MGAEKGVQWFLMHKGAGFFRFIHIIHGRPIYGPILYRMYFVHMDFYKCFLEPNTKFIKKKKHSLIHLLEEVFWSSLKIEKLL